jgi:polyisoprenoid-binding protein YceI
MRTECHLIVNSLSRSRKYVVGTSVGRGAGDDGVAQTVPYHMMKCKSKRVERAGEGKLKVTGDLTINAMTREVVLDGEGPTASIRDPRGNEKVGFAASTQISRKKFGITWNEAMESGGIAVADEVSISIDRQLIKNTKPQ